MQHDRDFVAITRPFVAAARAFCAVLDGVEEHTREALLTDVYYKLPLLISAGANLPDVSSEQTPEHLSNDEWTTLYRRLKENLGEWDVYQKVFDPTRDTEAIFGSLADDLADIYRDVASGLSESDEGSLKGAIFSWRLLFYSHWGKHAIDALEVIHCRLSESLMNSES